MRQDVNKYIIFLDPVIFMVFLFLNTYSLSFFCNGNLVFAFLDAPPQVLTAHDPKGGPYTEAKRPPPPLQVTQTSQVHK